MSDVKDIWSRIVQHAGEEFRQYRGKPFTYSVTGNVLRPSTTNWNIPRSQFELAYKRDFKKVSDLQDLQGPSYLFAILSDTRIG